MMRRKNLEKAWNSSWSKAYNIIWNMDQCDGMSMHDFQWRWLLRFSDDDDDDDETGQKQPDEYWSVQRFTTRYSINGRACMTSSGAGYCGLVMMMMMRQNRRQKQPDEYWSVQGFTTRYSINGQIHITYSKSNPGVFEGKKVKYSVSLLISTWLSSISLAEDKTKDRKTHKPTTTKSSAVKTWESITKKETQSLLMSMRSRLKAVIACKGFPTKYILFMIIFISPITYEPLKMGGGGD